MKKVIKRGYVKWVDEKGVRHKEPLYKHPELLKDASPEEQLAAEEARRLNEAAEKTLEARDSERGGEVLEVLEALKEAPADVLIAAELERVKIDGEAVYVEPTAVAPVLNNPVEPSLSVEQPKLRLSAPKEDGINHEA